MKKRGKKKHTWIKAFFLTFIISIILGVMVAGGMAAAYVARVIKEAEPIHTDQIYDALELSTQIYDGNGKLMDEIYYDENRKIVKYEQLPENLKNAFIAVEDKTFWEHNGFNFRRIFGALLDAYHGGRISGTSTISQQLARNIFLPEEKEVRSLERKITEMYYAYQIEETLSKEEILTAYLNTIYLGYSCYGVDTASRKYFSTKVEKLSLEQCAALAALPQAPGEYALLVNEKGENTSKISDGLYVNDVSEERRNMILDLMAEQGMVTREEADAAKKPAKDFVKPGKQAKVSQSSFKDYVIQTVIKDLAEKNDITAEQAEKQVYTKGLKIYSTLDPQAQDALTKVFRDDSNFPSAVDGESKVEAAMVISDVATGQVRAMAGSRKVKGSMMFNRAINPRQPGSSIKPLSVYSAALQKSFEYEQNNQKFQFVDNKIDKQGAKGYGDYITAGSNVTDEPLTIKGQTWPLNASRSFTGKRTFRRALELSINTCAVKLLNQIGIEYSMETIEKYGITTVVNDRDKSYNDINLAALGLGAMTEGVTPLEMSLAYAAFPNGGIRYSPVCYTKVEDNEGNVILDGKPDEVRVMDEGVAWIMTDILKTVVKDGIATDAKIDGLEVGGKTGTTNDNYDIWFDGFTPTYSAALWIGTDKNVPMNAQSDVAAALWSTVMSRVDGAYGGSYKAMPENVIKIKGEYYTKGTEPKTNTNTNTKTNQNAVTNTNPNNDSNTDSNVSSDIQTNSMN